MHKIKFSLAVFYINIICLWCIFTGKFICMIVINEVKYSV